MYRPIRGFTKKQSFPIFQDYSYIRFEYSGKCEWEINVFDTFGLDLGCVTNWVLELLDVSAGKPSYWCDVSTNY